jgi:hypothetical protein
MMKVRLSFLICLVAACGSEPASGPPRDTAPVETDSGADVPNDPRTDSTTVDVSPPDVPARDTLVSDAVPLDVPSTDVPVFDTPRPDAPPVDAQLDGELDAPVPDVFDVSPTPDAETDPVEDARPDAEPDVDPSCDADADVDGHISLECGGDDCDDTTRAVHPGRLEVCNFHDDNCNGEVNEDLDCRVYAHTASQLYLVDPFLGTDDFVTSVPSLFDFDTDPAGDLYGISSSRRLHVFDEGSDSWMDIGTFASVAGNGFAIDSDRVGYITAGNDLYTIDLESAVARLVGAMGGGFWSSGDCVVDKSDQLFMTSSGAGGDDLVAVSRSTGVGRRVGATGFFGIWGLTAAWGHLFGFTSSGEVVELDPGTGAGRLVHSLPGRSWYGAASSPGR